jgi:phosphatidylglycerophosphate synthase
MFKDKLMRVRNFVGYVLIHTFGWAFVLVCTAFSWMYLGIGILNAESDLSSKERMGVLAIGSLFAAVAALTGFALCFHRLPFGSRASKQNENE